MLIYSKSISAYEQVYIEFDIVILSSYFLKRKYLTEFKIICIIQSCSFYAIKYTMLK